MKAIRDVQARRGLPSPEYAAELFGGAEVFVCTIPELDPYAAHQGRAPLGTLALGRVLTGIGVPAQVTSTEQATTFSVPDCPFCYGRSLEVAGCTALVGLVEANLRLSAADLALRAEETACRGTGGAACEVTIPLPSAAE